jgi:hypothetical protein
MNDSVRYQAGPWTPRRYPRPSNRGSRTRRSRPGRGGLCRGPVASAAAGACAAVPLRPRLRGARAAVPLRPAAGDRTAPIARLLAAAQAIRERGDRPAPVTSSAAVAGARLATSTALPQIHLATETAPLRHRPPIRHELPARCPLPIRVRPPRQTPLLPCSRPSAQPATRVRAPSARSLFHPVCCAGRGACRCPDCRGPPGGASARFAGCGEGRGPGSPRLASVIRPRPDLLPDRTH